MTTFKFDGRMLLNDDNLLWRQMVAKEQGFKRNFIDNEILNKHGVKAFKHSKENPIGRYGEAIRAVRKNDLSKTQANGFYKTDYLKDGVDHFSDPPIV